MYIAGFYEISVSERCKGVVNVGYIPFKQHSIKDVDLDRSYWQGGHLLQPVPPKLDEMRKKVSDKSCRRQNYLLLLS